MMNDTMQHTSTQRELVRVVLKDTLRLNGIPPGTIGCEVTVMSRKTAREELFVHLIILKWNEAVLRYAPVIQQELIKNLDRFDPEVNHANYIFSWRFAAECEYPFKSMPAPEFWNTKVEAAKLGPVAAPTLPPSRLGHATWIQAIDHPLKARNDVRVAMLSKFNHDPPSPKFVSDCASRARPGE